MGEGFRRSNKLGRKNYLFAGSHKAAQNTAMIYSFLGTCKMQKINPKTWLQITLEKIPEHSIQKLEQLLPGYQEYCPNLGLIQKSYLCWHKKNKHNILHLFYSCLSLQKENDS